MFTEAIKIEPKNWEAFNSLGTIYNDQFFDYNNAKKCYQSALDLNPDSILIKTNLAEILLILKEYDESERLLNDLQNVNYNQTIGFVIRALTLCSYYLRGLTQEGKIASLDLLNYYETIPVNYNINWTFRGLSNMINGITANDSKITKDEKELILFVPSLLEVKTEDDRTVTLRQFRNLIEKRKSKSRLSRLGAIFGISEREEDSSFILPRSEDIKIVNTSSIHTTLQGWYNWEIRLEAP